MLRRFALATSLVGLGLGLVAPAAHGADLRGTLQGVDALAPSPRPDAGRLRAAYWEAPNGVVPVATPRTSPEFDVGVVLTGPGIEESTQAVTLRLEGGRCRPGTVVITPGTVLRIDNQDLVGHELYAVRRGEEARVVPVELTTAHTTRQITFSAAGVYELHDVRQPSFRCWVVAGPGQGRILLPAADGAFRATSIADGEYTVRAWFEGTERASATVRVAGHDAPVQLALGGGAASPGAGSPPATAPPATAPPAAQAAPPSAARPARNAAGRRR